MAPAQITIRFSLASKKYKFLTYIVKLVGDRDKRNAIHTCRISTQHISECQGKTINPPTQNATSMTVTFYDLQADTYKIKIQPDDPYWNTPGQCLCYQTPSNTSVRCVSCLVTSTRSITVAPQGAMLSTSSTSSVATDSFSQVGAAESTTSPLVMHTLPQGQAEESTSSMTVITMAVLAALGCVSVLTVGVALWRKKRANATRRLVYSGIPTSGGHDPGTHSQRGLFARKVYLMYAEDHKDHINVINSLATHLKKQCCCEVFYLRWFPREVQTMGAYEWILSHIDQADFVIIINSEAAFKLFEARHTNVSLRRLDEGPEGDTFSLALTHVLTKSSEPWFFRKTILAYFDYTDDDFILKEICPGVQYRLPKHFKEFVCHIHEMSGQTNIGEMVDLHATSSGRQLLEAIRKAKHFQKSDPQWFHKRFSYEEDSGFDTISPTCDSTVGADDSVSIATRPLRGMHIHPSESDNADEFKSAVTYDTAYAKSHGEFLFDMIPPSEVSLGASTGSICRRINNINKQNEINAVRFIPVPQTETDVNATSNSTYIRDPPVAASQGYSQSDSCVSMGGRDV